MLPPVKGEAQAAGGVGGVGFHSTKKLTPPVFLTLALRGRGGGGGAGGLLCWPHPLGAWQIPGESSSRAGPSSLTSQTRVNAQ